MITSEETYRTFYGDAGNRRKFYAYGDDDDTSDQWLPTLLMVPKGMVGWLAEKPRTPWEYMEQLLTELGTARVEHRPKQLKPSLARLCRAMSADGKNEKKSNADSFKW